MVGARSNDSVDATGGFSLLEVMMAIAILGLSLTVILSAQGGISSGNRSAANIGRAITKARCKMSELEVKMMKDGYPLIDAVETDIPCCEDEESDGFLCDTRVEKVELPNLSSADSDGGDAVSSLSSLSDPDGGVASALTTKGPAGGAALDLDGGLAAIGAGVQEQFAAAGGADGLLRMAMTFIYPTLKPMMEASIRRLTVRVHWKEGPNGRDFSIVQYVTEPQTGGLLDHPLGEAAGENPQGPSGGPLPSVNSTGTR